MESAELVPQWPECVRLVLEPDTLTAGDDMPGSRNPGTDQRSAARPGLNHELTWGTHKKRRASPAEARDERCIQGKNFDGNEGPVGEETRKTARVTARGSYSNRTIPERSVERTDRPDLEFSREVRS